MPAARHAAPRSTGLDDAFLRHLIDEHRSLTRPRLERLWSYYRNALEPVGSASDASGPRAGRWYALAQEAGLPARIVGTPSAHLDDRLRSRREVVVENDIAWRVQLMVDFMAGKPVSFRSDASDRTLRETIERVLRAVWEASGGVALLQDMALLGHVYGHADLVLRLDEDALRGVGSRRRAADGAMTASELDAIRRAVRIELVEPTRAIPVPSASDYRLLDGYVIHVEHEENTLESAAGASDGHPRRAGHAGQLAGSLTGLARLVGRARARRRRVETTEVLTPGRRVVVRDGRIVAEERSGLLPDVVPVVHAQNTAQPFRYAGLSEVEPLIPLQDELNTRLSDRACRVTMQSFKMYLAKGIDGFDRMPVGPGQVWSTDNPDAEIVAFGGDASSPSEDAHIEQVREAMDKVSAVPPLAGGVVRARIGNLSSANALRITLMSLLAKTARKRQSYGRAVAEIGELALRALDAAGVLRTGEADRVVRLEWPDPLPVEDGAAQSATETPGIEPA